MASSYFVLSVVAGVFAGVVFLVVGYARFARSSNKDPTRSLSWANVQLITWTGVILGSFVVIAFLIGGFPTSIPDNLLTLMGVSVGAQVGAKLTRTLQTNGAANKTGSNVATKENSSLPPTPAGIQGLMAKESDPTDLSVAKLQHLAWTIVGVIVYIIAVWVAIVPYERITVACAAAAACAACQKTLTLPDVGSGLPVLMGISASGYIANKIGDKPAQ